MHLINNIDVQLHVWICNWFYVRISHHITVLNYCKMYSASLGLSFLLSRRHLFSLFTTNWAINPTRHIENTIASNFWFMIPIASIKCNFLVLHHHRLQNPENQSSREIISYDNIYFYFALTLDLLTTKRTIREHNPFLEYRKTIVWKGKSDIHNHYSSHQASLHFCSQRIETSQHIR